MQVPIYGGLKSVSPYSNSFDLNCNNVDKAVLNFLNGSHLDRASFKTRPASCFYSNYADSDKYGSMELSNQSMYPNGLGNVKQLINSSYQVGVDQSQHLGSNGIIFVDSSSNFAGDDQVENFISEAVGNVALPNYSDSESVTNLEGVQVDAPLMPDSLNIDVSSSSDQETNVADVVSKVNQSVSDTIKGGENLLNNLVDSLTSSVNTTFSNAKEAVDNVIIDVISFVNKTGESANNRLFGVSSGAKEALSKAGVDALDVLRGTVVVVENSLIQGAKTVGYAYSSAKEFLPPDFQEALNYSEGSVTRVLNPTGTAFQQVPLTFLVHKYESISCDYLMHESWLMIYYYDMVSKFYFSHERECNFYISRCVGNRNHPKIVHSSLEHETTCHSLASPVLLDYSLYSR